MARQIIVNLIDDIDGGTAHETVTFGIDGYVYEIDLSSKNAKQFRAELATYVSHGTRVSSLVKATAGRATTHRGSATGRDQSRAIRLWAHSNGFEVASRGRLKREIVEQYHRYADR